MSKRWAVNAAALQCIAGLVVQEQRFMVEAEQLKKVNEHLPFTPAGVLLKVVTENVFPVLCVLQFSVQHGLG